MMQNLRILDGKVVEIIPDPLPPMHPDIVATFVAVPDTVQVNIGDLWDGINVVPDPGPPLAEVKTIALDAIDRAAGQARARYITVAPGQEAVYLMKDRQARDYAAAGYPATVPALVQSDANALGITPQQAADAIIAQSDAWTALAAQIEELRRGGKVAVDAAADIATVETVRDSTITALDAV